MMVSKLGMKKLTLVVQELLRESFVFIVRYPVNCARIFYIQIDILRVFVTDVVIIVYLAQAVGQELNKLCLWIDFV